MKKIVILFFILISLIVIVSASALDSYTGKLTASTHQEDSFNNCNSTELFNWSWHLLASNGKYTGTIFDSRTSNGFCGALPLTSASKIIIACRENECVKKSIVYSTSGNSANNESLLDVYTIEGLDELKDAGAGINYLFDCYNSWVNYNDIFRKISENQCSNGGINRITNRSCKGDVTSHYYKENTVYLNESENSCLRDCTSACLSSFPQEVFDLIKNETINPLNVRGVCTNGYDFQDPEESYKWGGIRFIEDKLPEGKIGMVWTPQGGGFDDRNTNGENYCLNTRNWQTSMGDGRKAFAYISGSHDDCVCYSLASCSDLDNDGVGIAPNNLACPKKGNDCWNSPAVNWDFRDSIWLNPDSYFFYPDSEFREKIKQNYKSKMDSNSNNDVADEVNPYTNENQKLYSSFIEYGIFDGLVMLGNAYVSACNDGIDNDCDGYKDCFDSGCFDFEAITGNADSKLFKDYKGCKNSCGAECLNQKVLSSGAECIPFSQSSDYYSIKSAMEKTEEYAVMLEKDYSDCSSLSNVCACKLDNCNDFCNLKTSVLSGIKPESGFALFRSREASEKEINSNQDADEKDKKCFIGSKEQVFSDYYNYYSVGNEGCCCEICEKKGVAVKIGLIADFMNWIMETFDLKSVIGKEILEKAKDSKKLFEPDTLIDSILFKLVSSKAEDLLKYFLCDDVVNFIKLEDSKKKIFYSLAVQQILTEEGVIKKTGYELDSKGNVVAPIIILNRNYDKDKTDGVPDWTKYEETYNEIILRTKNFYNFIVFETKKLPNENCKICPKITGPNNPIPFSDNSYFLFSDMLEGDFWGSAYSVEPHGIKFNKSFYVTYADYASISKYNPEDFSMCQVEKPLNSENFTILSKGINITYKNMTLSFPEGAVSNNINISMSIINFNCNPENMDLDNVMISARDFILEKTSLFRFLRFFNLWNRT